MNSGFQFQQFYVRHDRCAMKVGTDGVLLGALAIGGRNILDIGTGTGLCALMMAQRFPDACITAIDIDNDACEQATENIADSPFWERIMVLHTSLKDYASNFDSHYDSIISNPPFFEENLNCPDKARNDARHTSSLPFFELISCSKQLLTDDGTLTLILPTTALSRIESECAYANMFIVKKIYIRTTEKKVPKRVVLYIRRHPEPIESETQTLMVQDLAVTCQRSPWYEYLTKSFYLSHTPSDKQP
ncbi:MAG: methyltransferase [Prevotella sp.]|nr:methyltransferase [Prevotella sp.]